MAVTKLVVFSGLPGVGKSTVAQELARELRAAYVRVDSIEQALRDALQMGDDVGASGYAIGVNVAKDNVRLGVSVVADSVNPIALTRNAWRQVAEEFGAALFEVEIVCSDPDEHRQRVESRPPGVEGLGLPDWEAVQKRHYEPWSRKPIVIDTAGRPLSECVRELIEALERATPFS